MVSLSFFPPSLGCVFQKFGGYFPRKKSHQIIPLAASDYPATLAIRLANASHHALSPNSIPICCQAMDNSPYVMTPYYQSRTSTRPQTFQGTEQTCVQNVDATLF